MSDSPIDVPDFDVPDLDVPDFDAATPAEAADALRPACASRTWIAALVAGRPYRTLDALTAESDAVIARLTWADIEQALDAHPRIGDRTRGADRESSWSRQEQAAAVGIEADAAADLRAGNIEYERRFGQVFLICATGRSVPDMLAALRTRLGNDAATEREVVRGELRDIVRLRLAKAFR
ncbi:MAG: 2-oxo-4-hydroxy-4-carboxy--5-ureidoimidazoline decarboxylase [Pseudonocardiales bacterium]|nr:2-oxo-4-hydroxy-4-carboxy--5-ureidoimidazoline decarboxylase [Pseudonocardiales bacterium]